MSYWKTTIVVEVLSEQPFEFDDLGGVHYAITDGDCSGEFKDISSELITARQMHDALLGHSGARRPRASESCGRGRTDDGRWRGA